MLWLILLALVAPPDLGVPASSQQPDGSWKCSAVCHTDGNADAGRCRTPLVSRGATREACEADLQKKCAVTKPPPGGCRWGNSPPASR
jgi:hypothetical protein